MAPPDDNRADHQTPIDTADTTTPCRVERPAEQTMPVVFASPHSGSDYPAEFIAASRLDACAIRRSEDAFVDEIFATAPAFGAPLLCAHFPRAYVDPNRERFELDPRMFDEALPAYVNTTSPRIAAGLGTIARVVSSGDEIYRGKLDLAEAIQRIEACYTVYHETLVQLIEETRKAFGFCVVIDCHSMPSVGGPMDRDPGLQRVNMVLGDGHGTTCAAPFTDLAQTILEGLDFVVTRNNPYAGGFTTRHYGRPENGVHTLQIEINRAIYMDEIAIARGPGLPGLIENMGRFVKALAAMDTALFENV